MCRVPPPPPPTRRGEGEVAASPPPAPPRPLLGLGPGDSAPSLVTPPLPRSSRRRAGPSPPRSPEAPPLSKPRARKPRPYPTPRPEAPPLPRVPPRSPGAQRALAPKRRSASGPSLVLPQAASGSRRPNPISNPFRDGPPPRLLYSCLPVRAAKYLASLRASQKLTREGS